MDYKKPFIDSVIKELNIRKEYLNSEPLETIYFGGGTPSQLSAKDFAVIFDAINNNFDISQCSEITLEANPDDMTTEYAESIMTLPFNRISMGVQSFNDADLKFLNRRHDSVQAFKAVEACKSIGITNISIDLIYGLPGQTSEAWRYNIEKAVELDIPHISAYHLIYEEGTALYRMLEAGKIKCVEEEQSVAMFATLIQTLRNAGYEHYEISNFARPNFYSRHNSAYWLGKKYLGVGPSAHSFNGMEREWNVASLPEYIESVKGGLPKIEVEVLDLQTRYNDYIITGLRTKWGVDLAYISEQFGKDYKEYAEKMAKKHIQNNYVERKCNTLVLTEKGVFISDGIMSDLLKV